MVLLYLTQTICTQGNMDTNIYVNNVAGIHNIAMFSLFLYSVFICLVQYTHD